MSERFFTQNDIGTLLMEVFRQKPPKTLLITSPWITPAGLRQVEEAIKACDKKPEEIRVVLRVKEVKDLDITPPEAFRRLRELLDGGRVEVRISQRLHAKMIIATKDEDGEDKGWYAFISSSNITGSGFAATEGWGNLEAGVFVEGGQVVKDAIKHFEAIWEEAKPVERVLGVVMNPSKPGSVEIALFREIPEDSWVRVDLDGKDWLLARVDTVMRWNRSFFLNPFTQGESSYFQSVEEFFKTFELPEDADAREKVLDWHIARSQALAGLTPDMLVATAKVMTHAKWKGSDYQFETPRVAPPVGSTVQVLSQEDFKLAFYGEGESTAFKGNYALGKAITPDEKTTLPFYIDFEEILGKHMAVHGATGSGKSFFVKLFVSKVWEWMKDQTKGYSIVILDPHGEYDPEGERRSDLERVGFPLKEAKVLRPKGWPPELEGDIEVWRMWRDELEKVKEYEPPKNNETPEEPEKVDINSKEKFVEFIKALVGELGLDFGGNSTKGKKLRRDIMSKWRNFKYRTLSLDQAKDEIAQTIIDALEDEADDVTRNYIYEELNQLGIPPEEPVEVPDENPILISEILDASFDIRLFGDSGEARRNSALFSYLSSKYGEKGAAAYLLAKKFGLEERVRPLLERGENGLGPVEEFIAENLARREEYLKELAESVREEVKQLLNEGSFVVINLKGLESAAERAEVAAAVMETVYNWVKGNPGKRVLLVLDEAHNFAGSAHGETSGGKDNPSIVMARRIATEGRKFGLGMVLISQRVQKALDTTVRSQCNTIVLFRLLNQNDIKGAEESYEGITPQIKEKLPTLQTGEAFVSGVGVKYPLVVKVVPPSEGAS